MTTKLAAITTNFKRFTENQVLTESHLNQVLDYFDDQIRLSRTCLSGVGIVCGFEVSCNEAGSEITITQGSGITTDGDLFQLYRQEEGVSGRLNDFEEEVYNSFIAYDNTDGDYRPFFYEGTKGEGSQLKGIYELLPKSRKKGEIPTKPAEGRTKPAEDPGGLKDFERPLSQFGAITKIPLKDAVVLIYLENYENKEDLCISLNCDNQGIDIVGNYRILITSKENAEKINRYDTTITQINYAQFYYHIPEVILNKVVSKNEIFKSHFDLKKSFRDAIFKNDVVGKLKEGFTYLLSRIPNGNVLLIEIQKKLTELFSFDESAIPNDFQYRYDVLKDLVDTYNEIKQLLFVIEETGCCADVDSFPKHLMLGEVEKDAHCYAYRHRFYRSPILADQVSDLCNSCEPISVDYDLPDDSDGDTPCDDSTSGQGNHIVFIIDESGSFNSQKQFVKNALNGYLTSVETTNMYVSLVGMSANINNTRNDHILYKRANDLTLKNWVDNIYATPTSDGGGGSDFWGSGYQVVLESILDTDTPDPIVVIVLGDEGPGPYSGGHSVTLDRAGKIKRETKLFIYIVDSDKSGGLSGIALNAVSSDSIPSIDGRTDLDRSDYFITTDFADLEIKIKDLNEALIESNILCPQETEDEIVVDPLYKVCYDPSKPIQQLNSLIKRAALQLANYNTDYTFIKATPSLNMGKLSKKAIPFYYNVGQKLIEEWDFEKTALGRHTSNLSYHTTLLAIKKPLEVCVDADFYRIEGHHGRNYKDVVSRLKGIKEEHGLSYNVIALPITTSKLLKENFTSYYLQKNSGLEHKAGVPIGGTFVICYIDDDVVTPTEPIEGVRRKARSEEGVVILHETGKTIRTKKIPDIGSDSASIGYSPELVLAEEAIAKYEVIADFALPYLCCDDNNVGLSLPSKTVCFDSTTQPIPFTVTPQNGYVEALTGEPQQSGITTDDRGNFAFDPNLVSPLLIGKPIRFKVHNQEVDFAVTIYKLPEASVSTTINYDDELKTKVTVSFKVISPTLSEIKTYNWSFGDGTTGTAKPNATGIVKHTYSSPVNEFNIVSPTLKIATDFCEADIPIASMTFDKPIEALLDLEVNELCLKTEGCDAPIHVALVVDDSGSIDSTEAGQIRAGLTKFFEDQDGSNNVITILKMKTGDDTVPDSATTIEEKPVNSTTKPEFTNWVNSYKPVGGSDYWSTGLGYLANDLSVSNNLKTDPDIVIVIADGLQSQNIEQLKNRISILNTKTHIFYYALSNGSYASGTVGSPTGPTPLPIEALDTAKSEELKTPELEKTISKDDSIDLNSGTGARMSLAAAAADNPLVRSLRVLLGREPIQAAADFSNIDTTDYASFDNFSQLGDFLNNLKNILDNSIGCIEKVNILRVLPAGAKVEVAGSKVYKGLQIQKDFISINPNEFDGFDEVIHFTVDGYEVPETLIGKNCDPLLG